jgi:hypothetical protein
MVDQLPGTSCSHCGRLIPEPAPVTLTEAEDQEPENENGIPSGESQPEAQTQESEEAPASEEVVPEAGHVDNVGDETETPVP